MLPAHYRNLSSLDHSHILAQGRDLIKYSTRTFVRGSQRYSVMNPGTVLAIDQADENPAVEIFPGFKAHAYSLYAGFTRDNDRNPAGNFASSGTFTVDGVEPSKYTWAQAAPGALVYFSHRRTISNNAGYFFQLRVAKNTTGRVRFRVQDAANTDAASCDFDLITGTFINNIRQGAANHDFTWFIVVDKGTEWAVMCRWAAVSADGTTGSNGQLQVYLTDDAGSTTGAAIPSQVISFVQMGQNTNYPPYVPGAGLAVACAADSLILDPLPINFTGPGEIWAITTPNRWGAPFSQGGGNRYLAGWAPLDAGTEPWRTFGLNITTTGGGATGGGGNAGRGNGGGPPASSVSAYSAAQGNYWNNHTRQYLGGSWSRTQVQVAFDSLSVVGDATQAVAALPALSQPPRTFNRLNLYPFGSASATQSDTCVIGWPRELTNPERRALSRALIRSVLGDVYP